MNNNQLNKKGKFGTGAVFLTAISTILGAILFLRFGFAVANTGFAGTVAIIVLGHLVTIPTAMAVAEIATNIKVEGGGAYYIISRSFGLNIGAAIGIALFLSQAISTAFYVIAFSEAFIPFGQFLMDNYNEYLFWTGDLLTNKRWIGLISMALLTALMLTKGANIGVKLLYWVVALLFVSLGMFFLGKPQIAMEEVDFFRTIENPAPFFYVFTIIFPAFTGIAAGLGLSGDLKEPRTAIPRGTMWATFVGMIIYLAVAFKLVTSVSLEQMAANDLVMADIAIWGPIIPIGLAAASFSSALGSIMIAPRTLQALGLDSIFPSKKLNKWLSRENKKSHEPINASLVSIVIGFLFTAIGDINMVAEVIAMFFMVTYGAINSISFLEHFSADPSYRPTFRSKWYISLLGAVLSFWLMMQMNAPYAILSLFFMAVIYLYITKHNKDKAGLVKLFRGVIYQLNRQLQIYVQKRDYNNPNYYWRPFMVTVTSASFERRDAFDLMRWVSQRYGFGTFIHYINGFLNQKTYSESKEVMNKLLEVQKGSGSKVYLDTIISPSFTSALAQVIQLSGLSGKGHNLILFEFPRGNAAPLDDLKKNYALLEATEFDICILSSSFRHFGYRRTIHMWLTSDSYKSATLMVLLAYILLGHKEWNDGEIRLYNLYHRNSYQEQKDRIERLISYGRLPISAKNVSMIELPEGQDYREVVKEHSSVADLTMIDFEPHNMEEDFGAFEGFEEMSNILFVHSSNEKDLK